MHKFCQDKPEYYKHLGKTVEKLMKNSPKGQKDRTTTDAKQQDFKELLSNQPILPPDFIFLECSCCSLIVT